MILSCISIHLRRELKKLKKKKQLGETMPCARVYFTKGLRGQKQERKFRKPLEKYKMVMYSESTPTSIFFFFSVKKKKIEW